MTIGGAKSVLQVIDGELIETFTDQADEHAPTSRALRRGDVTKTTPSSVHEIANRSGDDATTIHAYSPPLADVAFFSLRDPGAVQWLRTIPVPNGSRRRAERPRSSPTESATGTSPPDRDPVARGAVDRRPIDDGDRPGGSPPRPGRSPSPKSVERAPADGPYPVSPTDEGQFLPVAAACRQALVASC